MKPNNYTFRLATESDLPFLTQALISAARASGEAISPENLHDFPDTHRYVLDFPQPRETGVIAELDGRPAGVAWFRLFSHLKRDDGGLAPEIIIGVCEDHRGKGLAERLMSELYTAAKHEGWGTLSLGVHQRNTPARRLYEKQGWKCVKNHGEYLLMTKEL